MKRVTQLTRTVPAPLCLIRTQTVINQCNLNSTLSRPSTSLVPVTQAAVPSLLSSLEQHGCVATNLPVVVQALESRTDLQASSSTSSTMRNPSILGVPFNIAPPRGARPPFYMAGQIDSIARSNKDGGAGDEEPVLTQQVFKLLSKDLSSTQYFLVDVIEATEEGLRVALWFLGDRLSIFCNETNGYSFILPPTDYRKLEVDIHPYEQKLYRAFAIKTGEGQVVVKVSPTSKKDEQNMLNCFLTKFRIGTVKSYNLPLKHVQEIDPVEQIFGPPITTETDTNANVIAQVDLPAQAQQPIDDDQNNIDVVDQVNVDILPQPQQQDDNNDAATPNPEEANPTETPAPDALLILSQATTIIDIDKVQTGDNEKSRKNENVSSPSTTTGSRTSTQESLDMDVDEFEDTNSNAAQTIVEPDTRNSVSVTATASGKFPVQETVFAITLTKPSHALLLTTKPMNDFDNVSAYKFPNDSVPAEESAARKRGLQKFAEDCKKGWKKVESFFKGLKLGGGRGRINEC
ncbi:hypothetical protein HDU76_003005 [Blyttiomyces sp. JEL0837]|nr:hypothetical protein HDU76_003005 [Blyttiomyces sp. JEL0837]